MRILSILIFLSSTLLLQAQSKVSLLDELSMEPIENATIQIKGTNKAAVSNENGEVFIEFSEDDTLQISHLKYRKQSLTNIQPGALIYLERLTFRISEILLYGNPQIDPAQSLVKTNFREKVVQPKNVGELFGDINGFALIKRGSYAMDPSMRASQYEQLNIQFDGGVKAMHACPSRMDPITTLVNPEEVSRIEIIKGPFSVRYGNTSGGIINMVTDNAVQTTDNFSGSVSSGYESNGNSMVNMVQLQGNLNKLNLSGNFSHRDYGDYEDGEGRSIPSSFRSLGYNLEAGYTFNENNRLKAGFRQSFGRDVKHAGLMMDTDEDNSSIFSLDYNYRSDEGKFRGFTAKTYYSFVDHIMNNYTRPSFNRTAAISRVDATTYGGKLETEWRLNNKWRLFTGVDVTNLSRDGQRERLVKMNMAGEPLAMPMEFQDKVWQDSYVNDYGLFAEAKFSLSEKDIFNFGARLDHIVAESKDPDAGFAELYPETGKIDEQLFSGTVAYKRILKDNYSLEFSYGRGARPANMEERYIAFFNIGRDPYEYVGNPNLKAEVNNQFEIGFKGKEEYSGNLKHFSFSASAFYSIYENYIVGLVDETLTRRNMPNQPPVHPKVFRNLDDAYKTGFELSGELAISSGFKLGTDLAYTYTQNEDLGESLPLSPPLVSRSRVEYENDKFWGGVYYNITADQENIAPSFGETRTPGYSLMDLKAGTTAIKNLNIGVGVLNVFDKYYHSHLNFAFNNQANFGRQPITEPGRNFTLFVNYNF
ncbi:TonB-dependent receptor [Salegentibacter sediminis]|uniref:TonB-dependent receptor n=1 Tax=Salegentibacter sediminis TaxID=1930251 RepID=UPI0009BF3918|nr:TonB-dependent receptor [Salegentibacter sediminis]